MGRPLRVLIVEDNPDDVELVLRELRRSGYEPQAERVDTAEAVRAALRDGQWDVVISDYSMPQFDALRALDVLRKERVDIPFLLVSGTVGEDTAVGAMRAGAHDYLLKDRLGRLGPAVERALEDSRVRRAQLLAEDALRESEERFRMVFEEGPIGMAMVGPDFRFTHVNAALCRMLGYTPEELIGRTFNEITHPDDITPSLAWAEQVFRGDIPRYRIEKRYISKRGEVVWVDLTVAGIGRRNGSPLHGLGIMQDITQRKRADDQILHQLETLTALYAGARKLTGSLDLQELADDIVRTYVEVFGATVTWVGRAAPDGTVRPIAVFPRQPDGLTAPAGLSVRWDNAPEGQGPTGRAIRTRFPVTVHDIAADPDFGPWRDVLTQRGIRSSASFPLIIRDEAFGALGVLSDRPGFFTDERVELFQAFANQAAAALENGRQYAEAQRRVQQLAALRTIDMAITGSLDLRVTLNVLLDQVVTQLGIDAADVLLLNPHTQMLEFSAGRGFRTQAFTRSRLRLGEGHAGRVALGHQLVSIADLNRPGEPFLRTALISGEGFVSYHAAPLVAKGQVKGVLEVFHRAPLEPDPEWLTFLEALAGQAAIAIDNATLFDGLQRSNVDLRLAYETTLEGWSRALDLRDKETEGHTQRVAELTARLARALGVSEEQLVHIRRGALLHDIGKMGIPDGILLKPGALTEEEWEIMRRHPVYAHDLLSPIPYLRPALDIPYCHHEKWDGTGYPRGLKGKQIPLAARIFAVVDVWDALTSDRPYRKAWPEAKARAHIQEQAGTHFDPAVVTAFMQLHMEDA